MKEPALAVLDANRIMTIATVRPDSWPQATIVGYVNQGFRIYFAIFRSSQKLANITRNNRIAITVGREPHQISDAQAVYAGCLAHEVLEAAERDLAWELLIERHPNLADFIKPGADEVAIMAADCRYVSLIDYRQGLGHSETISLSAQSSDCVAALANH